MRLDSAQRELFTEESGTLAEVWNHRITLQTDAEGRTVYRDTLELSAGHLTPVVWAFAQLFYRYRHHRWRALAPRLGSA